MGQIASYFKRRENDDFETILNELDESIRNKEENLAFIKQREKRSIIYFTSYSILIWLIYIILWWFGVLEFWTSSSSTTTIAVDGEGENEYDLVEGDFIARILKTLPVGGIPIIIFFTRRIVKSWYTRKQNAENKHLTALRKKQKDQIDKLKKLSNYDKITEMLERHGQVPPRASFGGAILPPGTPARQTGSLSASKGGIIPGSAYSTPIGGGVGGNGSSKTPFAGNFSSAQLQHLTPAQQKAIINSQKKGQAIPPNLQAALMASSQKSAAATAAAANGQQGGMNRKEAPLGGKRMFPAPPGPSFNNNPLVMGSEAALDINQMTPPHQPKTFIDKIADALLGGDEQSPNNKYALICQKCFSHNGLCLKDEVMDVQFVCPRCGHFNPSRRARMTGSTTKTGLSRPSSSGQGNGRDQAAPLTSKDVDEGTGVGADESMSLSSPTNHLRNPMLKGMRKGNDTTKEGGGEEEVMGDVSMDESDDGVDEMEGDGRDVLLQNEDKLTSEMNADERREKLRRRTAGRKAGKDIAE